MPRLEPSLIGLLTDTLVREEPNEDEDEDDDKEDDDDDDDDNDDGYSE